MCFVRFVFPLVFLFAKGFAASFLRIILKEGKPISSVHIFFKSLVDSNVNFQQNWNVFMFMIARANGNCKAPLNALFLTLDPQNYSIWFKKKKCMLGKRYLEMSNKNSKFTSTLKCLINIFGKY